MPRLAALILLLLALPADTHAVVAGKPARAPFYVATGICGGTLIAPDRVATAAHCVDPVELSDLDRMRVGDEVRRGIRVALPATWAEKDAGFSLDDIAIVQLDRPVTSVKPVSLPQPGATPPKTVRILGRGQTKAPAKGKRAYPGIFPLRDATLKTIGDAACAATWKGSGTKYRRHFRAASMLCAGDDRSSVCAGDSGGPMVSGNVLVGVISWTGPRCGADGLPSVAAETAHFRDFLTDPSPRWAPVPGGPARISGDARVGSELTCEIPAWEVAPDTVELRWQVRVLKKRTYVLKTVGAGATYTPKEPGLLACDALGSGPGGRTPVKPATVRVTAAG